MALQYSALQKARLQFKPVLPTRLAGSNFRFVAGEPTTSVADVEAVKALFPKTFGAPIVAIEADEAAAPLRPARIGVILSGGQAPGGHNVISGLYDRLKAISPESQLYGFLKGPDGLLNNNFVIVDDALMDQYRNLGGFDMLASSRTKIESAAHFAAVEATVKANQLDGLVIIGGDDSNTNAAVLAEHFAGTGVRVVGCPKTIDGDLRGDGIEASFGFDSACKVYSELIGNIETDCLSACKYWHFIRVMGRAASNIALECALQTQPNAVLVGEEVTAKQQSVAQIRDYLTDLVVERAAAGKDYGIVVVPEGLVEFIPEFGVLLTTLSTKLAHLTEEGTLPAKVTPEFILESVLTAEYQAERTVFETLPRAIQEQLLFERDPHGNIQVSRIETEKFFSILVEDELARRKAAGAYTGKFSALCHFFGYEGRAVMPSNFDSNYCYALGQVAALLIASGHTGMMACIRNLHHAPVDWVPSGLPITSLFNMELRHGKQKPVIRKYLVDLEGPVFKHLESVRDSWRVADMYRSSGPIQYYGPAEVCDEPTFHIRLFAGN